MKLMVVDDDTRIRKLIISIVSDLTTEIFECRDGREAHAGYAAHHPDLVLMDLTMPGLDGILATRLIRSEHPEAKIVIVTSHDGDAMRETARTAGACAFVLKEDISTLRSIILDRTALPETSMAD
jgi:two-component system response regulator DegU